MNFSKNKQERNANSQLSKCQLCSKADQEDISIIQEMLSSLVDKKSNSILFFNELVNNFSNDFGFVLNNCKFLKCLALAFKHKYQNFNDRCKHEQLHLMLAKDNVESNTTLPDASVIYLQSHSFNQKMTEVEEKIEELYESMCSKQEKLNEMKESFQNSIQSLFTSQKEIQEIEAIEDNLMLNDQPNSQFKQKMHFHKNSNKNKFQQKSIDILKDWFISHIDNPYPNNQEKNNLSAQTEMHVKQIQNWFTNARKRYLDPLKQQGIEIKIKNKIDPEHQKNPQNEKSKNRVENSKQKSIVELKEIGEKEELKKIVESKAAKSSSPNKKEAQIPKKGKGEQSLERAEQEEQQEVVNQFVKTEIQDAGVRKKVKVEERVEPSFIKTNQQQIFSNVENEHALQQQIRQQQQQLSIQSLIANPIPQLNLYNQQFVIQNQNYSPALMISPYQQMVNPYLIPHPYFNAVQPYQYFQNQYEVPIFYQNYPSFANYSQQQGDHQNQ